MPTGFLPSGPKVNVALQHVVVSTDTAGSFIETFTTYATVSALLTALSGARVWLDEKMTEEATHVAYVAYRSDLAPTDRLLYASRYYSIGLRVNPFNQNRLLKLNLKLVPA